MFAIDGCDESQPSPPPATASSSDSMPSPAHPDMPSVAGTKFPFPSLNILGDDRTGTPPIAIAPKYPLASFVTDNTLTTSRSYGGELGLPSKRIPSSRTSASHTVTRGVSVPKDAQTQALKCKFDPTLYRHRDSVNAELLNVDWTRRRRDRQVIPRSYTCESNFNRRHAVTTAGRDLRTISDLLHIEASGFKKGYDIACRKCSKVNRSSSFPGAHVGETVSHVQHNANQICPETFGTAADDNDDLDDEEPFQSNEEPVSFAS